MLMIGVLKLCLASADLLSSYGLKCACKAFPQKGQNKTLSNTPQGDMLYCSRAYETHHTYAPWVVYWNTHSKAVLF